MIRLASPDIDDDDISAVTEVLRTGHLVQGARVEQFENDVAEKCGSRHAVAVCNCTAALHLALMAIGVEPGDEIIVPPYSWPATANVIELCGARPHFVDVMQGTYGMDPSALRKALALGPRPKAVMVVHAFGRMAAIKELADLASEYGVPLIEDAACALGAEASGRQAGTWGAVGCFSFHPRKSVTTGEGGMLVTDDEHIAWRARTLRNHGQDARLKPAPFVAAGYNLRLTEFQAALGSTQLRKLNRLIDGRRDRAVRYRQLLADLPVILPHEGPSGAHVYQSYVVLLSASAASQRKSIIERLREAGVESTIGTHHIPMLEYYREKYQFTGADFPVSRDISSRALALPMHSALTAEEQHDVARALRQAL